MTFLIETSTYAPAVGAGTPAAKFVDYTHKLRFENPETGDTAEALATFGAGDELSETRKWAEAAHGLDLVAVEPFDAKAEHKARKAAAEEKAEELKTAQTEAEKIVTRAYIEAADIKRDAQAEADSMIAEAARILREAEAEAGGGDLFDEAEAEALAELQEGAEAGEPKAPGDQVNDAGEAEAAGDGSEGGSEGGKGTNRRRR